MNLKLFLTKELHEEFQIYIYMYINREREREM